MEKNYRILLLFILRLIQKRPGQIDPKTQKNDKRDKISKLEHYEAPNFSVELHASKKIPSTEIYTLANKNHNFTTNETTPLWMRMTTIVGYKDE